MAVYKVGYVLSHSLVSVTVCSAACAVRTTRYDAYHVESAKPTDGHREICSDDAELQIAELKTEVDSLRRQLADRDSRIVAIEDLRQHLERQLLSHTAEISVSSI